MAISRFSTSRVGAGLPKYQKFWDGSTVYTPPYFYSIQTATVDSGGASSITFSSISGDYKHLQLRIFAQANRATYGRDEIKITFNSDTGSNYSYHYLSGSGSSVDAGAGTSNAFINVLGLSSTNATSVYGGFIIDLLDYTNTNKYTTLRYLSGIDHNGTIAGAGGVANLGSGLWMNTNAVTSINIVPTYGTTFSQYSQFALYGIKA